MEKLLKYGLFDNELKHVSEVENGLACGCICPNCNYPLVAKNNPSNIKAGHFAHYSGKECEGAIETALHLLAKAILLKTKRLKLPKYHFDYNPYNEDSVFRLSRELTFDNIILEKPTEINGEKITPDAIGVIKDKNLFIEFANTHFVDDGKIAKIKKSEIACIEIDLKGQALEEDSLTSFLNSDTPLKYWVVNKKLDSEYLEFTRQQEIEQELLKLEEDEKHKNKEEKIRAENEIKVSLYKNQNQFNIFLTNNWGRVNNCPLKRRELKSFKTSSFYRHPVLKRIIDGEYWNGEFYGWMPNGKYIYLNNKKTIMYPADEVNVTEIEIKENKFFHAGLIEMLPIVKNPEYGDCKNCKFFVDTYYISEKNYAVCRFKPS